jgi:succinoglycan biosynthesis transport protein ExoP
MSIIQFLRILWAYRLLVVVTTVTMLIGGTIAMFVVPPAYEAETRVLLNTLKPDPVTGEVIQSQNSRTFVATQIELIRDYGVAGEAVDKLGWLANPDVLNEFHAANGQDKDLRRALAQRIIDRTKVTVPMNTNILEISFRAASADEARLMANALREAYIDSNLATRRRDATRNAEWYLQQADKEKVLLDKADEVKTAYERDNNIVMQDEKTDIETARLRALSSQASLGAPALNPAANTGQVPATNQLTALDAQIAQASKSLGPKHPAMIEMNSRRALLQKMVTEEQAASHNQAQAMAQAMGASTGALGKALEQQTQKVLANRDKIERLNQLQTEVNLHREQLDKALARAAELRQQAAVTDSGIVVLSEAVTPKGPVFPNKPLIAGGAIGIGAALGLLLSLILEFLNRHVRGVEDLQHGLDVPMLAVISPAGTPQKAPSMFTRALRRLRPKRSRPALA